MGIAYINHEIKKVQGCLLTAQLSLSMEQYPCLLFI